MSDFGFGFDPDLLAAVVESPAFSATQSGLVDFADLVIEPLEIDPPARVVVPIDVQALVAPEGGLTVEGVHMPFALTQPDGEPAATTALPFDSDEITRPRGVHLHWALPDALLSATMVEGPTGRAELELRPLPDFWVVLRLTIPKAATRAHVRGFVVRSTTAEVIPLDGFDPDAEPAPGAGRSLDPAELTSVAGGSLTWTASYDATVGRFAIHDPLDDLDAIAPDGFEVDRASYCVAGVWSEPQHDLIRGAVTRPKLDELLAELGWKLEGAEQDRLYSIVDDAALAVAEPFRSVLADGSESGPADGSVSSVGARVGELSDILGDARIVAPGFIEPPKTAMFHGVIHGVPLGTPSGDNRPPRSALGVSIGTTEDAALSALIAPAAKADDRDEKAAVEETLAAFTGQLIDKLGTVDGVVAIDESEHRAGFTSRPSGEFVEDRYLTGGESGYLSAGRHARGLHGRSAGVGPAAGAANPAGAANRANPAGSAGSASPGFALSAEVSDRVLNLVDQPFQMHVAGADDVLHGVLVGRDVATRLSASEFIDIPPSRTVRRAGPRYYQPIEPLILVSGAGRSLRHGGDGRFCEDGLLSCRLATELETDYEGLLRGDQVVPSISVAGIPAEVNGLAQEALLTSPFFATWLGRRAATLTASPLEPTIGRFHAEAAARFGANGTYDGRASLPPLSGVSFADVDSPSSSLSQFASGEPSLVDGDSSDGTSAVRAAAVADMAQLGAQTGTLSATLTENLLGYSQLAGSEPDAVGVTVWNGQPWIPLWLEWRVELDYSTSLDGWRLGQVDYEPAVEPGKLRDTFDLSRTVRGRTLLTKGPATQLASAIDDWLADEDLRDIDGTGLADEAEEQRLADIAAAVRNLDVVSATLSTLHEALLGLVTGDGEDLIVGRDEAGNLASIAPVALPELLMSGRLRLSDARLVDAFGRVRDLPTGRRIAESDRPSDNASVVELPPRLTVPTRWKLTLVDAASAGPDAAAATVDQVQPDAAVNPVAGFLLPDHIDESLEVFNRAGDPLGQLTHEPFGGGVAWQVAPGRPVPADAGPTVADHDHEQPVGEFAAELMRVDANQRTGLPRDESESPLAAMLRAIDTTLWSVDTFGSLGSEHIAGLVGRPVAVVRANLSLDIEEDLDRLDLTGATGDAAGRAQRYAELARQQFTIRLGEITRSDDGLLGFFVNGDYSKLHLVDKVVAGMARESGRQVGHLGIYGQTPRLPAIRPIDNAYVVADDELALRVGETVTLTLLMHPGGRVHYTSGIVPRRFVQLQRDWVAPGLGRLAPSVRVGPVLVDTDQVRLPLINSLGQGQLWSRRTAPTEWRHDPILAATQAAMLPDMPAEFQEGYVRVTPTDEEAGQ